jgi:hypothetical protein
MYCMTRDFGKETSSVSYNFGMPNIIYVQLQGREHACKIEADKIEEQGTQNSSEGRLVLKNGKNEVVGDFKSATVVGWWKHFE